MAVLKKNSSYVLNPRYSCAKLFVSFVVQIRGIGPMQCLLVLVLGPSIGAFWLISSSLEKKTIPLTVPNLPLARAPKSARDVISLER